MLYHKIIGGKEAFSDCRKIDGPGNTIIYNPTAEQIAAAGWELFIPPEPEPFIPTPQDEPDTYAKIEAVKKMLEPSAADLTDKEALAVAALFPTWHEALVAGTMVQAGERRWDNGLLWKCKQSHIPQADWRPEDTPALWQQVTLEETPEWVQPIDAQTAYNTGEQVKHNGHKWESSVDNNVWEPGVYGWTDLGEIS